jgi:hydrogenase expression/formation protein HypC
VIVHVGFAISRVDEQEAQEVFRFLEQMDELDELQTPDVADFASPATAQGGNDALSG